MISNIFEKSLVKILIFFLISPGSKYKRKEIKEKTRINNVPLDNTLNKLLSLGLLKIEKNLFKLNPEFDKKFVLEEIRKEFINLDLPYELFIIILEISDKLSKLSSIEKALLFGSYAKLIYTEKSDIDIAIITKNEKEVNKIKAEINRIIKKFKKNIELHFFSKKDLKQKDPLIKEILRNNKKIL